MTNPNENILDSSRSDEYRSWLRSMILIRRFEEAAGEMKDKAKFGKVDVDKNQDLAQKYQVMSIPTLILFKDGEQVERIVGVVSKEDLIKKLKAIK